MKDRIENWVRDVAERADSSRAKYLAGFVPFWGEERCYSLKGRKNKAAVLVLGTAHAALILNPLAYVAVSVLEEGSILSHEDEPRKT